MRAVSSTEAYRGVGCLAFPFIAKEMAESTNNDPYAPKRRGAVLLLSGGYNSDFVENPPDSLLCPVCLLPFRDPVLLSCCGRKGCDSCFRQIKNSGHPCPICQQPFETTLDKVFQSKVLGLRVFCSKKKEGCRWESELRDLETHSQKDCAYVEEECRYRCGLRYQRRFLRDHEMDECPQRPPELVTQSLMRKTKETGKMQELESQLERAKDTTKLLSVMESLKRQSLSLEVRVVKLIFTGMPKVGKSTLKKRIMKEMKNLSSEQHEINPNTGLENSSVMQIPLKDGRAKRAAFLIPHTGKESSHAWEKQDLKKQLSTLFDSMLTKKVNPLLAEGVGQATYQQASKDGGDVVLEEPAQRSTASPSSPFMPLPSFLTDISTIVDEIDWHKARKQLALIQEAISVYIVDTGSQPEFHEVLPFVLQGPALHLVLFSLLEDEGGVNCLDRKFEVEYISKERRSAKPYNSAYPVKEVLFQLLASFHSLYKAETCSQQLSSTDLNPSLHTPQALLVGTYKDKLFKGKSLSQQRKCSDEINQKLITTFSGADFYGESFLSTVPKGFQPIEGGRYYVAIDNMHGTAEEMQLFRELLSEKISEVCRPIEVPCSVLLFHLLLRYHYEKPGTCTLEESKKLAEKCQIPDVDVTKVLKYLHLTLGTILYYEDVPSLKDTVFCDPNVLLSRINELIAVCFTSDPAVEEMAKSARKTGVIKRELWKYISSTTRYQGSISLEKVMDFLLRYKLMTKIDCGEELRGWFMPCLLLPNPHMAIITADILEKCTIYPLLIRFCGNTIPLGQFTSLLVQLCLKQWKDGKPWRLAKTGRYRNQVTFVTTDSLLRVKLKAKPQFIEVIVEDASTASQSELYAFCFAVKRHILEAIKETCTGHSFCHGFYCPGSLSSGQIPHFAEACSAKVMMCTREEECTYLICNVPEKALVWVYDHKLTATEALPVVPSCKGAVEPQMEEHGPSLTADTDEEKKRIAGRGILDKHICAVTSVVKTNLNNFFMKLLENSLVLGNAYDPENLAVSREEKATKLYLQCRAAVGIASSNFSKVVDILNGYPLLNEKVEEMKREGKNAGLIVEESAATSASQEGMALDKNAGLIVEESAATSASQAGVSVDDSKQPRREQMDGFSDSKEEREPNAFLGVSASDYKPPPIKQKLDSSDKEEQPESETGLWFLDVEPTEKDLWMLVATKVTDYHGLGIMLGISYYVMEMFELEHRGNTTRINMRILTTWIREQTRMPTTWGTLVGTLHDLDMFRLAHNITEELKERLDNSS